jgi:hypothetical protein
VNEIVQFSFYPVGGFTNTGINKSVQCPTTSGNDLPDVDCEGDKYEACLMNVSSCVDSTCPQETQLGLSQFLDCFEGEHGSQMSSADTCAKAAGFDVGSIHTCYNNAAVKAAVWKSLQARTSAKRPTLTCFPWVEVNGQVLTDNCFGPIAKTWPLLKALCEHSKSVGITPPAACTSEQVVV